MEILISYKNLCQVFVINANIMKKKIKKRSNYVIFSFYIIIYKHILNIYIFNYRVQINYTIGYKYFIDFLYFSGALENDSSNFDIYYKQYLLANMIDCTIVNKFNTKNFLIWDINYLYKVAIIQDTMS